LILMQQQCTGIRGDGEEEHGQPVRGGLINNNGRNQTK
jgi:hypothetical protein